MADAVIAFMMLGTGFRYVIVARFGHAHRRDRSGQGAIRRQQKNGLTIREPDETEGREALSFLCRLFLFIRFEDVQNLI